MARHGTLRTWNDDRGFGFIAPVEGGRELFVHVSAFPRDGARPTAGESLLYEMGRDKDGKPQAVNVQRRAFTAPAGPPRGQRLEPSRRRSLLAPMVGAVLLAAVGTFGYSKFQQTSLPRAAMPDEPPPATAPAREPLAQEPFRCDGRTHCSQMTSCAEAKFFLANCPGTKMDGNNDGVPCEQQWCTSPFAR